MQGQDIEASQVALMLHGMQITGNGGYDLESKHLHGHIEGDKLVLSKFKTVQKTRPNVDGTLTLVADANGTMEQPGLKANAKLAGVTLMGKLLGDVSAECIARAARCLLRRDSTAGGREGWMRPGRRSLTGDYQTQAKVTSLGWTWTSWWRCSAPGKVKAQSAIGGV